MWIYYSVILIFCLNHHLLGFDDSSEKSDFSSISSTTGNKAASVNLTFSNNGDARSQQQISLITAIDIFVVC